MMRRRPPGPFNGVFTIPHICRLALDPVAFADRLARRFGDVVYYRLVTVPCYQINHPQLIRDVLATKGKSFRKLPRQMNVISRIFGNGLLVSHGDHWLRQRRLLQQAFHNRRMPRYAHDTVECATRIMEDWRPGQQIDIGEEMTRLMVAVTAKIMFSLDILNEASHLGENTFALSRIFMREVKSVFSLPDWLPLPVKRRKQATIEALNQFVDDMIQQRRATGDDRGDLLSMLLLAIDESGDGTGMSDRSVRDEAMTMLYAGYHSTSAAMPWIWYLLAKNSEAEARAFDEVQTVLGGREVRYEDLASLKYVEMVVKESLRLQPPAWALFAREAVAPVEIGGYTIPKGAWVFMYPWVVHRDPRFFENPETFDPERFAPGREEQIPNFAYMPFGGGPHQCIGGSLSMVELTAIVATMLQRIRFTLPEDHTHVETEADIVMRPVGLKMKVEPRWASVATAVPAGV